MFQNLKTLFGSTPAPAAAAPRRPKLGVEPLEAREVPAYISGGSLLISGYQGDDSATVDNYNSSYVSVTSTTGGTQYFLRSQITTGTVYFWGYGGNDYFSNNVGTLHATAYGGAGDDTLI